MYTGIIANGHDIHTCGSYKGVAGRMPCRPRVGIRVFLVKNWVFLNELLQYARRSLASRSIDPHTPETYTR